MFDEHEDAPVRRYYYQTFAQEEHLTGGVVCSPSERQQTNIRVTTLNCLTMDDRDDDVQLMMMIVIWASKVKSTNTN